jgi:hypothetical protein
LLLLLLLAASRLLFSLQLWLLQLQQVWAQALLVPHTTPAEATAAAPAEQVLLLQQLAGVMSSFAITHPARHEVDRMLPASPFTEGQV